MLQSHLETQGGTFRKTNNDVQEPVELSFSGLEVWQGSSQFGRPDWLFIPEGGAARSLR